MALHDVFPKSNDFANSSTLAGVLWKPDNETTKVLAIAYKESVVLVQNIENNCSEWKQIKELKTGKLIIRQDEYISVISFSKSDKGSYLVAGTTKGNLIVWHVQTGSVILETKSTSEHEYPICSIDWSPKIESEVAFINSHGYWGTIENIPLRSKGKGTSVTLHNKVVDKKSSSSDKEGPQTELNEDELAAALFEGKFRIEEG